MQTTRIYSYMLFEPGELEAKTLLSFQDQAPALVEQSLGRGTRALFCVLARF